MLGSTVDKRLTPLRPLMARLVVSAQLVDTVPQEVRHPRHALWENTANLLVQRPNMIVSHVIQDITVQDQVVPQLPSNVQLATTVPEDQESQRNMKPQPDTSRKKVPIKRLHVLAEPISRPRGRHLVSSVRRVTIVIKLV
jgi:hypothetical protein